MRLKRLCIVSVVLLCAVHAQAQRALTLEECKELALRNNYSVKSGMLEIVAAEEVKRAAFTKYFPQVGATGFAFKADDDLIEIMSMGMLESGRIGILSVVQPVFAGGRIVNGNRLASLGVDVSEYKNRIARDDVLLKTEEGYWRVEALDEKLKTIAKYEELLNSLQRQVEDAYSNGIVMKNDVLKVRLRRSEVLLNKSILDNGKRLATMDLCQHVGIAYDSTLVLADSLAADDIPESYYMNGSEALMNRPEYHLLQASVKAEQLQTRMKLGEYLPSAGIGIGVENMKYDEGRDRTNGMIFGTVQVPLSGWWEASYALKERSVKEQIARNNLKENSELLGLQMEKAWQDLTDAYKQVSLSEEAKAQAEENMKVNADSYDNGLITVSDLLEAQALLRQAKDQLTDAKTSYRMKIVGYLNVTGRTPLQ